MTATPPPGLAFDVTFLRRFLASTNNPNRSRQSVTKLSKAGDEWNHVSVTTAKSRASSSKKSFKLSIFFHNDRALVTLQLIHLHILPNSSYLNSVLNYYHHVYGTHLHAELRDSYVNLPGDLTNVHQDSKNDYYVHLRGHDYYIVDVQYAIDLLIY